MPRTFDPAHIDYHLKRSAKLRSEAVTRIFGGLWSGLRDTARACVAVFT